MSTTTRFDAELSWFASCKHTGAMPRDVATARNGSVKGVEFSDELIVLGAPGGTHILPKGSVFVHRGAVAQAESETDPCADAPGKPRSLSEHFEHTKVDEETPLPHVDHAAVPQLLIPPGDVVLRPPGKRRARFYPDEDLTSSLEKHSYKPGEGEEEEEPVETSCTDSDASGGEGAPRTVPQRARVPLEYASPESEEMFQESTRINTKLNSMPSGGTFSFMNSSEDIVSDRIETSESESSTDDEDLRSSRRMIRVDGSAKLSSASGLGDEDFLVEDDEFGIEGAERVDEEEAIQVRSFGRSFAKVSLKDGEDVIIRDPRKRDKARSEVAFALPEVDKDGKRRSSSTRVPDRPRAMGSNGEDASEPEMNTCRSDPPRRKSRLRMTFTKRAATANAVKNAELKSTERRSMDRKSGDRRSVERGSLERQSIDRVLARRNMEPDIELSSNSDSERAAVGSCFPTRKTTLLRQRTKSATPDAVAGVALEGVPERQKSRIGWRGRRTAKNVGQLVAIPDMNNAAQGRKRNASPERKIVKNVSLQHDDWIDFATNAARGQRHPWFVRVLSNNKASSSSPAKPSKPTAAQTDPDMSTRKKSKRFWKLFSRKGKK